MPTLTGNDLQTACSLVLDCYQRSEIEVLMRERLNIRLEWIVRDAELIEQVAELFDFANRHRLTGRLLKEFLDYPPPDDNKKKLQPLTDLYPPDLAEPTRLMSELISEATAALNQIPRLPEEVVEKLEPFRQTYSEAAKQIDMLRRYKRLHDCLHLLQLKYREIARAAESLVDDPSEAGSLSSYADGIADSLDGEDAASAVETLTTVLPNPGAEMTWIQTLRRAVDRLHEAADNRDCKVAEDAVYLISRILDRDPIRIHGMILRQSQSVPLRQLIYSLVAMTQADLNAAIKQLLAKGVVALEEIHVKLSALVDEHTAWQNLDNSLRIALESWYEIIKKERQRVAQHAAVLAGAPPEWQEDGGQSLYVTRLLEDWNDVAEKFSQVCVCSKARRLDRLIKYANEIREGAASGRYGQLFDSFEPFSQQALMRFVEVDKNLLTLSDQLTRIGEPLQSVLEVLPR